jgi:4'-phosphopantetheinyl transferase EntD
VERQAEFLFALAGRMCARDALRPLKVAAQPQVLGPELVDLPAQPRKIFFHMENSVISGR